MRWRIILIGGAAIAAAVVGAVVYAQLSDTQTASGTVNVTTTASADLYICEPDSTPGPDCGADDSGADEIVFETLEDMLPADVVSWDIRLKNVGTTDWVVSNVTSNVVETADPGADCSSLALRPPPAPLDISGSFLILGKNGDEVNDNPASLSGLPRFALASSADLVVVKVVPGDYEDVRLALRLDPFFAENCEGNEWNVTWQVTVLPLSADPTPTPIP